MNLISDLNKPRKRYIYGIDYVTPKGQVKSGQVTNLYKETWDCIPTCQCTSLHG